MSFKAAVLRLSYSQNTSAHSLLVKCLINMSRSSLWRPSIILMKPSLSFYTLVSLFFPVTPHPDAYNGVRIFLNVCTEYSSREPTISYPGWKCEERSKRINGPEETKLPRPYLSYQYALRPPRDPHGPIAASLR